MFSIQDIIKKINSYLEKFLGMAFILPVFFFVFFIFLTAILALIDNEKNFHHFVYKKQTNIVKNKKESFLSHLVASKNGKIFYYSWCSGINRIKEENRIYFRTAEEAIRSGRVVSKTCLKKY